MAGKGVGNTNLSKLEHKTKINLFHLKNNFTEGDYLSWALKKNEIGVLQRKGKKKHSRQREKV